MKAVIFAAGESTRTVPLTLTRPKPLLPVVNKPIVAHQLEALAGLVDEAIVVVGYKREMLESAFGDRFGDIRLQYQIQNERKGTGHALLACAEALDGPFIAMNGDDLYAAGDLARLAEAPQGVLAKAVDNPQIYGVFSMDSHGNAVDLVEKPADPPSNLVNTGAYKFTPDVFSVLDQTTPSERGEIEVTCAVRDMIQATGTDFRVIECESHWLPIGYAWHLITANAYLLEHEFSPALRGEVSPAAHLNGAVSVGTGTVIRPGVVIDGPVSIGDNASIGPNAWIRPGTTIGNGCKVGQSVEIKCSVIMDGAKVPHLSYIGDSVVGANANIGCGTVTANFRHDGGNHRSVIKGDLIDTGMRKFGTIIGDDVHTGINTSIYPGRKLWPHTSTLPGEVVQQDKMS